MIFSYGFLEDAMVSGNELFLDLHPSEDDPLGMAKTRVSNAAPGVKFSEKGAHSDQLHGVEWYSDFIWLVCVNEEDGLEFRVLQTNDGGRELKTYWKEKELQDTSKLKEILQEDPLWEVFQLRAVVLIQRRIEEQLQVLYETSNDDRFELGHNEQIRKGPRDLALRLRALESKLLEKAYSGLDDEVCHWLASEILRLPNLHPLENKPRHDGVCADISGRGCTASRHSSRRRRRLHMKASRVTFVFMFARYRKCRDRYGGTI
jgi:hypothetical protein